MIREICIALDFAGARLVTMRHRAVALRLVERTRASVYQFP